MQFDSVAELVSEVSKLRREMENATSLDQWTAAFARYRALGACL